MDPIYNFAVASTIDYSYARRRSLSYYLSAWPKISPSRSSSHRFFFWKNRSWTLFLSNIFCNPYASVLCSELSYQSESSSHWFTWRSIEVCLFHLFAMNNWIDHFLDLTDCRYPPIKSCFMPATASSSSPIESFYSNPVYFVQTFQWSSSFTLSSVNPAATDQWRPRLSECLWCVGSHCKSSLYSNHWVSLGSVTEFQVTHSSISSYLVKWCFWSPGGGTEHLASPQTFIVSWSRQFVFWSYWSDLITCPLDPTPLHQTIGKNWRVFCSTFSLKVAALPNTCQKTWHFATSWDTSHSLRFFDACLANRSPLHASFWSTAQSLIRVDIVVLRQHLRFQPSIILPRITSWCFLAFIGWTVAKSAAGSDSVAQQNPCSADHQFAPLFPTPNFTVRGRLHGPDFFLWPCSPVEPCLSDRPVPCLVAWGSPEAGWNH